MPAAPPRPAQPSPLETAPAVVVSLAISLGVIVLWLAALVVALGVRRVAGKDRLLEFLSPGSLSVAVAMVVAVVLVAMHQQRPAGSGRGRSPAPSALMVAIVLAGAVGVASLLRGIIEMTIAHQRVVVNLGHFLDGLAAVPVAAATVLWGLRARRQGEAKATMAGAPAAAAGVGVEVEVDRPSPFSEPPSRTYSPPPPPPLRTPPPPPPASSSPPGPSVPGPPPATSDPSRSWSPPSPPPPPP
jgi:hypothetical protein